MTLKALILDMDGVLLESAEIRDDAFSYVFGTIGCDNLELVLDIHRRNFGLYRKEKLALIYRHVFNKIPSDNEIEELYNRFTEWVLKRIFTCPFVPGAMQFLEAYQHFPLYIVSAAPQDEVLIIAKHHKIDKFFQGIYGAPRQKDELINLILEHDKYQLSEVAFIGDRISDWKAANRVGIKFIGRVQQDTESPFPSEVPLIKDLTELHSFVKNY